MEKLNPHDGAVRTALNAMYNTPSAATAIASLLTTLITPRTDPDTVAQIHLMQEALQGYANNDGAARASADPIEDDDEDEGDKVTEPGPTDDGTTSTPAAEPAPPPDVPLSEQAPAGVQNAPDGPAFTPSTPDEAQMQRDDAAFEAANPAPASPAPAEPTTAPSTSTPADEDIAF